MKKLLVFAIALFTLTQLNAQGWGQTQKVVASDRLLGAVYGNSVAIQGDNAVIGSKWMQNASSSEGAVYMLTNDGSGVWTETQKVIASDKRQFDAFGISVDMDGNFMIVGSRGQDYDENGNNFVNAAGAAYIFEKDGSGNWNEVQKLVASDRGTYQPLLGESVAISGNYAVIAAPREEKGLSGQPNVIQAGAAYIFERDGTGTWNEVQKIVASDRFHYDWFGGADSNAVSIDGNTIVVGAYKTDEDVNGSPISNVGAAYVFVRDASGVWNETQKLLPTNFAVDDRFGFSVAISGNTIIVGCYADDEDETESNNVNNAGSAYIYEEDGAGTWNLSQKIVASDRDNGANFGWSVNIENNRLVVGAWRKDDGTNLNIGAAYVFEKDGTGTWIQQEKLLAIDRAQNDEFGFAVAISGDFTLVGARHESEDENGVNTLNEAGSAYIFDANEPSTLSIVESNFGAVLKAYPNPTNGEIMLDFGKTYNQINISITNVLGQETQTQTLQSSNKITLTLNEKSGIYFVNISTREGESATIKVLKK